MNAMAADAVCFVPWFDGHNNPRYTELFPRLDSAVHFVKVPLGRRRLVKAAAFRVWKALKRSVTYPLALPALASRYRTLLAVDAEQLIDWPRPASVVLDMDDAEFTERELGLLSRPQLKAVIVTTERARSIYLDLGLRKPIHVIPQGVSLDRRNPDRAARIAGRHKLPGEIVAGYHAPTLTLAEDGAGRARDGLDDLDFLFAEFEQARREKPELRLWLIGQASRAVARFAKDRSWVRLFGYVPFEEVLDYVSCFDLAVYPRTYPLPPGRFSVKIAQYLAMGVGVVSTAVEESEVIRDSGGGVVAGRGDFAAALAALAESRERRESLGQAGREYARERLSWPSLVERYRGILQ